MTENSPVESLIVLLDTNVWLDRYLPSRPRYSLVKELLDLCVNEGATILYPLRALQDVFYQVTRDSKAWVRESYGALSEPYAHAINGLAWDCINSMMEAGAPVGADGSDVWIAQHLRNVHTDFEDNMVLAAAMRAKADYLVTSDQQLIQKATVAALTPQDMLEVLRMRRKMHQRT